jgi:hypothetical protein
MTGLTTLWLPILLSAVLVFFMSSLVHMVLPWHKGDYPKLPDEDRFRDAVRPLNIPPGDYVVPRAASMKDMSSDGYREKLTKGPVVWMTVRPNGNHGMTTQLAGWFVYTLLVGVIAGYVTGRSVAPGTDYLHVFRFAGATAFACYAMALPQLSIWFHRSWRITILTMFDGLIYALLTAGAFGWLWPKM